MQGPATISGYKVVAEHLTEKGPMTRKGRLFIAELTEHDSEPWVVSWQGFDQVKNKWDDHWTDGKYFTSRVAAEEEFSHQVKRESAKIRIVPAKRLG